MQTGPIIPKFTFGEVSPLLWARGDLSKYSAGCKEMVNFIPLLQGPAKRRGGTRFIALAGNGENPVALLRFVRDEDNTFIIEAGDRYLRFFRNGAPVTSAAGPYQIASPWGQADLFGANGLCALKYVQSADVMYIVCPGRPPHKLLHYGDADWRVQALDGWGGRPNASCITLWRERLCLASGNTLYMSQAGAFENFETTAGSVPWARFSTHGAAAVAVDAANGRATSSGAYQDTAGQGFSVTVSVGWPVDEAAAVVEDSHAIRIEPLDAKKGISRVSMSSSNTVQDASGPVWLVYGVSDPTEGSVAVVSQARGLFGKLLVDPQKTSISLDGANTGRNQYGYVIRGSEASVAADDPIEIDVYSDAADDIEWLCPSNSLLVGTGGGELIVGETTPADPFGPDNCKVSPETAFGSAPLQPLRVGSAVMFAQRAGRKIREFVYDYAGDNYLALDMTVAAEHITKGGVTCLAWQSEPAETLWATRPDGQLIGFAYSKDQDLTAWHRHQLGGGGRVSQIAVVPSAYGGRDELWLSVRRETHGRTVYCLERMESGYESGDDPATAFFVDSGITARGNAMTAVSGLDHLEGRTVAILADGGVQPPQVVKGGAIPLKYAADTVQAGLPYTSYLTTVNLELALRDGTMQGRIKRIVSARLRMIESLGGAAGHNLSNLEALEYRRPNGRLDEAVPLFTGDARVNWPHGYETEGQLTVAQEFPLPFTLAAIIPEVSVEGRDR